MPTYDYRCEKCGYEFEKFQGIKDAPVTECPECKGQVKRLIGTGAGIIFKGKGFYQTDYKGTCPAGGSEAKADKNAPVCGSSCDCPHKK